MKNNIYYALGLAILCSFPELVGAQYVPPSAANVPNVVSSGGWTPSAFTFNAIIRDLVSSFGLGLLIKGIALIVIARAALLLIVEQSEGELGEFKKQIVSALIAIVLIFIADPISQALFQDSATNILSDPEVSANMIQTQFLGIIDFIEEPIAVIAVIMIIVSGIRTVLNWGGSDGLTHLKRTVISIMIGLFLIVAKGEFVDALIVTHSPDPIIEAFRYYIRWAMGFVTLIAVAILIFAGFLMIVNIGKDDQYQRAKGIVIRVAIGLIVILASMAIAMVFLV